MHVSAQVGGHPVQDVEPGKKSKLTLRRKHKGEKNVHGEDEILPFLL